MQAKTKTKKQHIMARIEYIKIPKGITTKIWQVITCRAQEELRTDYSKLTYYKQKQLMP